MARNWPFRRSLTLAAGALGISAASIVLAQEGTGGKTLNLTFGQTLEASDNIDLRAGDTDTVFRSSTALGLAYSDVTRIQSFRFATSGSYRADNRGETDVIDPTAAFTYTRQGANSRLTLGATYTRRDLDDKTITVAMFDPATTLPVSEIVMIEGGVRTNSSYSLGLETGIDQPLSFSLDLIDRARRYSGTDNPDLFDTHDRRIATAAQLRLSPVLIARLTAEMRRYEAEDADQTDRKEIRLGAGMALEVSPTLTFDAAIRRQRREVQRVSGDTVTEGLAYDTSLSWTLKNGGFALGLSSEKTPNGRRTTLNADRNMTLRRDGALSYGVGLSKTGDISPEPLFRLSYAQPLKRGRFAIDLTQQARTDDEDDSAVITTRLQAAYSTTLSETLTWSSTLGLSKVAIQGDSAASREHIDLSSTLTGQINDLSSWSAGLTFSDTRIANSSDTETDRRYGIRLSLRRALAQDWDLLTSYNHTAIRASDSADRSANTISVGLEKRFSFRP